MSTSPKQTEKEKIIKILPTWRTHQNEHINSEFKSYFPAVIFQPKIPSRPEQSLTNAGQTNIPKLRTGQKIYQQTVWILITIWILVFISFEDKIRFLWLCLWNLVGAEGRKDNKASVLSTWGTQQLVKVSNNSGEKKRKGRILEENSCYQ